MSLRIIGGELRRRQLKTPQGNLTRPYTDRVRQALFDRIADKIPAARVADIYSGVGTMGLESISRGATSCVFFEANSVVYRSLKENVQLIADGSATICWKTDVRYTSFVPQGSDGMLPYTLLFFDPPFAECHTMEQGGVLNKSLTRLARPAVTSDDALLLVRTPKLFELPVPGGWELQQCFVVSSMKIWHLTKPKGSDSRCTTGPSTDDLH